MVDEPTGADAPEEDRSLDAVMDRAFGQAFSEPAEAVSEEAPESGPARGPDGKFVAKDTAEPVEALAVAAPEAAPVAAPVAAPEPVVDAPAWLNDASAKAVWAQAPAELRDHLSTRFSDMEKGINEYRAKLEPLRAYAEMAESQGTTIAAAMDRYVGIERELAANPLKGLEGICQNMGLSLRDVAAHVLGQPVAPVDEQVRTMSGQMREMQSELDRYRKAEEAQTLNVVTSFAAEHPRWAELEHTVAWAIKTGAVQRSGNAAADLEAAYKFVDRLVPAATPPAPVAAPAAVAQAAPPPPKKAGISIDGAPGSNPTVRPKARNSNEAVDRVFDQLGL
jgi:hypothetical protein